KKTNNSKQSGANYDDDVIDSEQRSPANQE
ncbi:unnamed protein product, partial [Rotaria sp. Silwood1]